VVRLIQNKLVEIRNFRKISYCILHNGITHINYLQTSLQTTYSGDKIGMIRDDQG